MEDQQLPSRVLQHRNSMTNMNMNTMNAVRRQDIADVLPAAVGGVLSSGLTPISIFSNLLNAYATLDSKHDITSRLVDTASSIFNPSPKEASADDNVEELKVEPKTTSTTTEHSSGGHYNADVVDAQDLPPVRSNVDPNKPLRQKPPSSGAFRVTPAPNLYSNSRGRYGVNNPHYYTMDLPENNGPTTENYGPDDFVVETVKLDKAFFHQFFTSKPLLLGTDVVTSTSIKVQKEDPPTLPGFGLLQKQPRKRGRETSADLPEALISLENLPPPPPSKLQQMALMHRIKVGGGGDESSDSAPDKKKAKPSSNPRLTVSEGNAASTASEVARTTTTTTTRRPMAKSQPKTTTTMSQRRPSVQIQTKTSDVPKIINSVKTFKRYYIPPEVKITHSVSVPEE